MGISQDGWLLCMFKKRILPNCSRLAGGTQKAASKSQYIIQKNKFGVAKVRIIGIKRLEKRRK